jgi:glycine/D-amino acid oxidase-like deaminating enzyme
VVGLGGSGLAAIHAFLDQGLTVIGIDSAQVAGGAAGANGGFLLAGSARFYHLVIRAIGRSRAHDLYVRTIHEIERMQREMPDLVRRVGSLRIAASEEERADCVLQYEAMTRDLLPVERYDGPEGQGLMIPTDAVFNPLARCRRLAHAALQRGARLFEGTTADQIVTGAVRTPQGLVRCKHVVVAVDGKLAALFPQLGDRVRTARLQMIGTAPTTEVSVPRAVYSRWGYEYWQQLEDGRVVLGGFRDRAIEEEWTDSSEPTPQIQALLEKFLHDSLRVHAPITHRWAASVGYTENGLPIIESIAPGVWAVGGYNGTGNVMGALCARGAVEVALGQESTFLSLLRPKDP